MRDQILTAKLPSVAESNPEAKATLLIADGLAEAINSLFLALQTPNAHHSKAMRDAADELKAVALRLDEIERDRDQWKYLAMDRNAAIGTLGQENERLRESMRSILTELRNGHISTIGLRARAALDRKPPFQCKACERIAAGTAIPAREWEGNTGAPSLVSLRVIPSAWMRIVRIASTPDQPPGEYDVECYAGDEPPEDGNKDWLPLYRRAEGAANAAPVAPTEPPPGLLVSMAIRLDHGLGVPGYYDHQMFGSESPSHKQRLEAALITARQMWEEVIGRGFYRPEHEAEYVRRYKAVMGS